VISLFNVAFIAIGCVVLRYALKLTGKARQSKRWPFTEGEIEHGAAVYPTAGSPSGGVTAAYTGGVASRYQVNGKSYSSSKITLLDTTSTAARAQIVASRYPNKSKVRVFYNPADPSEAVLEPGTSSGLIWLYFVGALFALGGLFFLMMGRAGRVKMTVHVGAGPY
jgi:hypothetical protein